jgi:hypothetical protein
MIGLFNFSENHQVIDLKEFKSFGIKGLYKDLFQHKEINMNEHQINMYPYEYLWLKHIK